MDDYSKLFEIDFLKILVPILFGLVSWFIKDYLFAQWKKREELLHAEWKQRLTEVWSPLFYWSGIVLFNNDQKSWEKHGIKELENILANFAHLIQRKHYYVLIKLIEINTALPNRELTLKELSETREYIFKQIEILNFVLYKRTVLFDPKAYTTLFGVYQSAFRSISQAIFHFVAWALIAIYGYLFYISYLNECYICIAILATPIIAVFIRDMNKRYTMYKELKIP